MRGFFGSFGRLGSFGSHEEDPDFGGAEEVIDTGPPPSPVGQDERRMQVRAYNHWASMLGDRNFPAIEDLEPADLPDFGPYGVLLDFSNGIDNPGVPFLGERLAAECGTDSGIRRLGDVPSLSLLSRITDHYMQILANQAPIGFEAEFVNGRGLTVLYRGILLPFSSDDETIDFIYGVINWKEVADQQTADALLLELDTALGLGAAAPALPDNDEALILQPAAVLADAAGGMDVPVEAEAEPVFTQPEWDEEADDDASDIDDAEGEELPSLVAMPLIKTERRKAAALDLAAMAAMPASRMVVNGAPEVYEPYELAAAAFHDSGSVATDLQASADVLWADTGTGGGRSGPASAGGNLPVLHAGQAARRTNGPPAQLDTPAAMLERIAIAMEAGEEATGLHDCLASARELADAARNSEDRTRGALYRAVSRAYDFSLAAAAAPEDFAELLADNGLAAQDRAPMTPVVKLVFGTDYDKTRLAEYALVLTHAARRELAAGGLKELLQRTDGGIKALVAEERRARRGQTGDVPGPAPALAEKLAERLRTQVPATLDSLSDTGPEFALVLVRRLPEGGIAVVGEVPENAALVNKAARTLLG